MSEDVQKDLGSEWSYPIASEDITGEEQAVHIEANKEQRDALARRLDITEVRSAKADMTVKRNAGNMVVYVHGTVQADLVQQCVVTLEPVDTRVEEEFEAWYADPDQAVSFAKERQRIMSQKYGEEAPILDESEDPEPIANGEVDLGELATQYLILGLDPYPHAEGVHYEIGDDDPREDPSFIRENPFAKLKEWKDKL